MARKATPSTCAPASAVLHLEGDRVASPSSPLELEVVGGPLVRAAEPPSAVGASASDISRAAVCASGRE